MRANRKGSLPAPELELGDSQLIRFYRGLAKDPAGRLIGQVWQMTAEELEDNHDFIQWLFPLPQRSKYNPKAPVLSQKDIDTFIQDKVLRERVRKSYWLMLRFLGFTQHPIDGHSEVVPFVDFHERASNWLRPGNHNYLRISRMLNFLMLIQLQQEARAFFQALEKLNTSHHKKIGSAFSYWRAAVA
jgi:hypothetical protein